MRYRNGLQKSQVAASVLASFSALALQAGCGKAIPLSTEGYLGDAVLEGTDGVRVDGSDIGNIYPVTTIVAATQGNPFSTTAELPFLGPARSFGDTTLNSQWPFYFTYSYPANNYKLAEAHLVMDITRDTSETEGIFVDGVFSGQGADMNTSSTQITHHIYKNNTAGQTANYYFSSFPVAHYRHSTRNTFDLLIDNLLTSTPTLDKATLDLVKDGRLNVVTGDDAAAYSASLVLKGYTISKEALDCENSPTYAFQNVFMHNDGNTISQAAFSGTVVNPYSSSQTAATGFRSVEWNYDAQLPGVTTANITITSATLGTALSADAAFRVKRSTSLSPKAAIVINGVGVAETGFDKTLATSAVESWETGAAVTYFESWVAAITDDNSFRTVTLDLVAMLGAAKVRTLLAQGKLNVALAGSLNAAFADGLSTSRAYTPSAVVVKGPDLAITGTYFTELCTIPDNPSSPLSDNQEIPSGLGDNTSPLVNSLQANQITSSSAVIQWLTNEPATSQVGYGIGNTNTVSSEDPNLSTFHSVQITGLQAYKVYTFRAFTEDANGNKTTSGSKTFQTLR